MKEIAIYGKGGIGKSTLTSNISAALAACGERVLQIGCDPKHDSTRLLTHGERINTVLDYIRDTQVLNQKRDDILKSGYLGIGCVEAGGPRPGVGCAGRGIITAFELLDKFRIKDDYDVIMYDVLGDVVCGGFAVPIRREYADEIFVVTSGEYMSIYAANNILRGIRNYDLNEPRVAGILYNSRNVRGELETVERFARAVSLPVFASIPRSDTFSECERNNMTVIEKVASGNEAGNDALELNRVFSGIAERVMNGVPHYEAMPLTDEELEDLISGDLSEKAVRSPSRSGNAEIAACHTMTPGVSEGPVKSVGKLSGCPEDTVTDVDSPLSKNVIRDEPLHGCAFNGAAGMSVHIRDAVVLLHAPKSCSYLSYQTITSTGRRTLYERGAILPSALLPGLATTNMTESDMVFGGTDKLLDRVREITRGAGRRPRAVVIISSCPAGIIGDDIERAKELSTPECPVITVKADGNLAGDYLQGMLMAYTSLAKQIIDPETEPEPDTVNIVFEKVVLKNAEANFSVIKGFLSRMGVKVNCRFLYDTTFDAIRRFRSASLNLLAYKDYTGEILKDFFEKNYGSVFFDKQFPVGFRETESWLRGVGDFFGKKDIAEEMIREHETEYRSRIEKVKPYLEGRRLFIITYNHEIDWILGAALDCGINIVKIAVLNFSQDEGFRTSIPAVRKLDIVEDYDREERPSDIKKLKPDIVLGNYGSDALADGVIVDTIPMGPDAGFFSGLALVERWAGLVASDNEGEWHSDRELFEKYYGQKTPRKL